MPTKYLMTWNAKQKRWSKKYKKHQYWVSPKELGAPPTKEGSRVSANEWWENKRREIDSQDKDVQIYEQAIASAKRLLNFENAYISDEAREELPAQITTLERELETGRLRQLTTSERDPFAYWDSIRNRDLLAVTSAALGPAEDANLVEESNGDTTIGGNIATFLKHKLSEVETDALSPGRYESLRCHLQHFETFAKKHTPVNSISSQLLLDYRTCLLNEVKREWISDTSAQGRMTSVRQFVRHLWRLKRIDDLPRVLDTLQIRLSSKAVKTFTDEEIEVLLRNAKARARLYVLLPLNCGMLQKDISDLKHSEVDWSEGLITRKRSKTQHHEAVPTVRYKLWSETFELLKEHRSDHPELALTNRNGNPLRKEWVGDDGKVKRICNISSVYFKLRDKLDIKKAYKLLRKTSASKLASRFPSYRILFLGQSATTIADKHYISYDQNGFDEAVTWLGEQFGR